MAWGLNRQKSKFELYMASLGQAGIWIGVAGLICAGLLAMNLYTAVIWTTVQAEVRSIDALCKIETKVGRKRISQDGMPCDQAERIKDEATDRYYSVDSKGFINFAWTDATGTERTARVEEFGIAGNLKDLSQGDVVALRVTGGKEPSVFKPRSWKTIGGLMAFTVFALWMLWPSNSAKPSRFYVKGGAALGLRVWFANWALRGAIIGGTAAMLGLLMLAGPLHSQLTYTKAQARVASVDEKCTLSWWTGGVKTKKESSERMDCARANELATASKDVDYRVNNSALYRLEYTDTAGIAHTAERRRNFLKGAGTTVGSTVDILVNPSDPTEMKQPWNGRSLSFERFALKWGAILLILSVLVGAALGLRMRLRLKPKVQVDIGLVKEAARRKLATRSATPQRGFGKRDRAGLFSK